MIKNHQYFDYYLSIIFKGIKYFNSGNDGNFFLFLLKITLQVTIKVN